MTACYPDDYFAGILIDTGAAKVSTASKKQYSTYIKAFRDTLLD
jgi:hypothetical protein